MIKRVFVDQLRPGMFVQDLNAGWIPHSELHQRGRINSEASIEKLRALGLTEVYIDTERGADVVGAPTAEAIAQALNARLFTLATEPLAADLSPLQSLDLELSPARQIHREAKSLIDGALKDVKLGHSLEVGPVANLAEELINSVFRNHNALACLSRIRDKDHYLLEHSVSISVLMSIFARSLGMAREFLRDAVIGALLHDIGKVLIDERILHKPGKLDAAEFEAMRAHARHSRELLRAIPGMSELAITVAAQHHEKLDGSGYPDGLRGQQISTPGRMVAICDVYDALTADRCYKRAMPPTIALRQLLEWSDSHLDHTLVHHFIKTMGVYPVGSLVHLSNERFAVVIEQHQHHSLQPRVRVIYHAKYGHYLPPTELDLAHPNNQVHIVGPVDPRDHQIDLRAVIEQV